VSKEENKTGLEKAAQAVEVMDKRNQTLEGIDKTFGDNLPYDKSRLENECRFYLIQGTKAMLEMGKRLILIKEHEVHGDFTESLKAIGVEPRTARRVMKATLKFKDKTDTVSVLKIGKLYTLMTESDDDLQELEEGGTVGGMTLDDIDRMTNAELKKALRKEKSQSEESAEIAEEQLKEKSDQINDLDAQLKRRTKATPDEIHAELMTEIDAQTKGMMTKIAIINARAHDLMDSPEGIPLDMKHHIASQCNRLVSRLKEVIHNNDLTSIDMALLDDDDLDEDGNLDWMQTDESIPSAAEKKAIIKLLNEQGKTQSLGMAVSDAEAAFMTAPYPLDVWSEVLKENGFEGI